MQQTAIADAIADVTTAAQRILDERLDLLRLQVRDDIRTLLGAAVVSVAGVGAVLIAVVTGAAAVVWTIALWLPLGAALGIVAGASLACGALLTWRARKQIPGRLYEPPALGKGTVTP
jgi:hypothetical protein